MHLTLQERLALHNQYEILANLETEPNLKNYYIACADIVEHGFEGEYDELSNGFGDPLSESECSEIITILEELHRLEIPFDGLPRGKYRSYVRWLLSQDRFVDLLTVENTNKYGKMDLDDYWDLIVEELEK